MGQIKIINGFLVNNTPKKYRYKVIFKSRLIYNFDDINSSMTPAEVGKEMTEKIM